MNTTTKVTSYHPAISNNSSSNLSSQLPSL